jgi:general secretion pathway protein A
MYEKYFGLTERPFSIAPDPRFLYMSHQHREALAHLLYGVGEGGGFVQLTGEVGTGKTTVCRCLLEQLPAHVDVALILNPSLTALELLASVCDELRIAYPQDKVTVKSLTDLLNAHLLDAHSRGRRTVLILDEAQNLTAEALEEVRLLTNLETTREKLLQIILIGQPELRELLARDDLRQLAQRITARYHLRPIRRAETAAYIRHRLQVCGAAESLFTEAAIDAIHKRSQGVPRLINVICDRALLGGFVEGKIRLDASIAQKAATEVLPLERAERPDNRAWRWLTGAVVAAGAAVAAYVLLSPGGLRIPGVELPALVQNVSEEAEHSDVADDEASVPSQVATTSPPSADLAADTSAAPANIETAQPVALAAVAQAPSEDEQPAPLANALAAAGPAAAARAWAGLYRMWGVESSAVSDDQACAQAPASGLRCMQGGGSWAMLNHLDRPAVLLLVASEGRRIPVLLREVRGTEVDLQVDGRPLAVELRELEQNWFGEYRLLWKVPPGGSVTLRPGNRGPDVEWLRGQLRKVTGSSAIAPQATYYDAGLRNLVAEFQRDEGLRVDGVAGPRTLIHLNTVSREPSVPRLGATASGG